MTVDRFKKMFTYNYWANDKVWERILALSEEQFNQPCDYSIGSICDQLNHQMMAEELWLTRIRGDGQAFNPSNFNNRDQIKVQWESVKQAWFDYLNTLSDDDLEAEITFVSVTYGTTFHNPRWEGIIQILNHSTDHRAQILSLIHQVGGETSAQDFIFYTWGK